MRMFFEENLSQISRNHKIIITMVEELGYEWEVEKFIGIVPCDIYIPAINLVVEIEGIFELK